MTKTLKQPQTKSRQIWVWALIGVIWIGVALLSDIDYRWGAFGGAAFGIIGGIVGAYYGIKRAGSAEERALLRRLLLLTLLLTALFATGFLLIPGYYRFMTFIPCGLGLFFLVRSTNRRRSALHAAQRKVL